MLNTVRAVLRTWRSWFFTIATFLVFLLVTAYAKPVEECVATEYSSHAEYAAKEYPARILTPFEVQWGCDFAFLTTTEGAGLITAFSTIIIAIFTGTLWRATTEQGRITTESLSLATREFIAAQRPKLRVRLLKMKKLAIGEPIYIQFVIFNVGNTPARDIQVEITVRVMGIPTLVDGKLHYEDKFWTGLATTEGAIAAGDAADASQSTLIFDPSWSSHDPDDGWANGRLAVIGKILYSDDNGVKRRTAFYRFCTDDLNRFRMPDFPPATLGDHEYED